MPRPSKNLELTGAQALYAFNALVAERKISERDVHKHVINVQHEIAALEEQLRALRGAAPASTTPRVVGKARKRSRSISPARRDALRKQGLYLALMRQIPKTKRAAFKTMRKERGVDPALNAMQKAVNATA